MAGARAAPLLLVTLLGLGTTIALTALWQGRTNTLHDNGCWITSKTFLERGTIGGVLYRITRPALYRNRLDLGAWFGFQEVVYREPLPLAALEFDFRLEPNAWLAVLFNGRDDAFDAVRLSRHAGVPSAACAVDADRLFTRLTPLDGVEISDGWHRGRVEFDAGSYRLSVDGQLVDQRRVQRSDRQQFGFKGGWAPATVDDVTMVCRPPDPPRTETFANWRHVERTAAWCALFVLLAHAACWAIARVARPRSTVRRRAVYHVATGAFLLLGSTAALAVDHFWLAARYPADVLSQPEYPDNIDRTPAPVPAPPEPNAEAEEYRILCVGSSQTWGCGARRAADVWVAVLERALNRDTELGRRFRCINAGVAGGTTATLLRSHRRNLATASPHMVVIDLGHNDWGMVQFGENLARFAQLNQEAGARTVFLLEPNAREAAPGGENLVANHAVMKLLGERAGIPVIDMQAAMDANADAGFLWWDVVHLTTGGDEVFARALLEQLRPLLIE